MEGWDGRGWKCNLVLEMCVEMLVKSCCSCCVSKSCNSICIVVFVLLIRSLHVSGRSSFTTRQRRFVLAFIDQPLATS